MKGSGEVQQFAMDLAAALGAMPGLNVVDSGSDKRAKFLAAVVKDLKAAGAEALVVAGPRQPASVHALAALINQKLGSGCVVYTKPVIDKIELRRRCAEDADRRNVGGPGFDAGHPGRQSGLHGSGRSAIRGGAVEGREFDSSGRWKTTKPRRPRSGICPKRTSSNRWGDDAHAPTESAAIQQPMIEPMYGGKTAAEIVALADRRARITKRYDIVKNYWLAQWPAKDKEQAWRKALHDGVVAVGQACRRGQSIASTQRSWRRALAAEAKASASGIEVGFYPSAATWDGRFANNGWMQEAPDPITKLVWGNAALISPTMARDRSSNDGDMVSLSRGNLKLEAAVMVQPGHADDAVSICAGLRARECGRVGKDVGFNANLIRTRDGFWFAPGLRHRGRRANASTRPRRSTAHRRAAVQRGEQARTAARWSAKSTSTSTRRIRKSIEEMSEVPELHSIYSEFTYDKGNQWGMAIDLDVLHRLQRLRGRLPGRKQHSGRRQGSGAARPRNALDPHGPLLRRATRTIREVVEQPIPCMQCENAPCENVCPVQATTHSPEGLNDMAYNRCVGTRYCANNCPFKVRHFNFLNFHKHDAGSRRAWSTTPTSRVRMRGVMEKCTYCVQRIEETKIKAKGDGRREIKDGEIETACQQTCPADAIVFGNINDPNSRVAKLKKQERNYAMLAELDIKPRTTYLAKLRNPNPELTMA